VGTTGVAKLYALLGQMAEGSEIESGVAGFQRTVIVFRAPNVPQAFRVRTLTLSEV